MRVSKPPLLRMSALLPLTVATTFHVPAWPAYVTRSFCWTLVLVGGLRRGGVGLVPSHQTSPSAGLRATLVKIVLLAGMAMALRSMLGIRTSGAQALLGIRREKQRRQP